MWGYLILICLNFYTDLSTSFITGHRWSDGRWLDTKHSQMHLEINVRRLWLISSFDLNTFPVTETFQPASRVHVPAVLWTINLSPSFAGLIIHYLDRVLLLLLLAALFVPEFIFLRKPWLTLAADTCIESNKTYTVQYSTELNIEDTDT